MILEFSFDSVNLIVSILIWNSLYIDVQTIFKEPIREGRRTCDILLRHINVQTICKEPMREGTTGCNTLLRQTRCSLAKSKRFILISV